MVYYIFDLETSGTSAREDRIMQFAGQLTDTDFNPLREPDNILIKLHADVLPEPEAILLTGITPQSTQIDGITEKEFIDYFNSTILQSDMVFFGFNTVRFDDEFMRFLLYRNFADPYEWHWDQGRSRWDLLDLVRQTRALRPDGIEWPFTEDGKQTCRLELITKLNGLSHEHAHDAQSDVQATIAVAKLIKSHAPKLFDYSLKMRQKKAVADFVASTPVFLYTCGKYPEQFSKTSAVCTVALHPDRPAALVYDLRHDPTPWLELTPEQLVEAWKYSEDKTIPRLPIKTMQFNRCPAIAPMGVLDAASQERLQIDVDQVAAYAKIIRNHPKFASNLLLALATLDKEQQARYNGDQPAEARLYDGFVGDKDKTQMRAIRALSNEEVAAFEPTFSDERLAELWPRYKSRNYPQLLSADERAAWDSYVHDTIGSGTDGKLAQYFEKLGQLSTVIGSDQGKQYILEELTLYAQSLLPSDY